MNHKEVGAAFLLAAAAVAIGWFAFMFGGVHEWRRVDDYIAVMQKEYPIVEFVGNAEYVCRRVNPEEKK